MERKKWVTAIDGKDYTVEVQYDLLKVEIYLDGRLIEKWVFMAE